MKISELVITCFNLNGMLTFYKNIFNLSFREVKISQGIIYIGMIDDIQRTTLPCKYNKHQRKRK